MITAFSPRRAQSVSAVKSKVNSSFASIPSPSDASKRENVSHYMPYMNIGVTRSNYLRQFYSPLFLIL